MLRHGRAFDMPARTAGRVRERVFPSRLVRAARLPQHEIGRVALVGSHLDPRTGDHVFHAAARQRAIGRHRRHAEQHMTLGRIGVSAIDQRLDHVDHIADEFGRTRLVIRRQRAKRRHILMETFNRIVAQPVDTDAALGRTGDDLVVDIGDVPDIGHLRIEPPQQPHKNVEHHDGTGVADMNPVIDRRPAGIDPHMRRIQRDKVLFAAGQRVVKAKRCHALSP